MCVTGSERERGQSLEFPLFCKSKPRVKSAEPQLCRGSASPAAEYSLSRITRALADGWPSSGLLACSHAAQNDTSALSPHRKWSPTAPALCPNKPQETGLPSRWCVFWPPADRSHPDPRKENPAISISLIAALSPRSHMGSGAETSVLAGQSPINEAARQPDWPSSPHVHLIAPPGGADKR